jgi:adenosylcobinamide kinase/adenosylcobinamide-phosphate guanylyltransferase
VLYVATATAGDDEMRERIAQHRAQRPAGWATLEASVDVAAAARAWLAQQPVATVLVEDLTLLLSNLMPDGQAAEQRALAELDGLLGLAAPNVILVSNEVGMGLVPPYPVGRLFRDALGRLNQAAAGRVDEVHLLVAGLPLRLK